MIWLFFLLDCLKIVHVSKFRTGFNSKQLPGTRVCQEGKSMKAFGTSKQHDSHQSQWGTSSWNLTKSFQIILHLRFPVLTETGSWNVLLAVFLSSFLWRREEAQGSCGLRLAAASSAFLLEAEWHLTALPCNPVSCNRADRLRARAQLGFLFGYGENSRCFSNLILTLSML